MFRTSAHNEILLKEHMFYRILKMKDQQATLTRSDLRFENCLLSVLKVEHAVKQTK